MSDLVGKTARYCEWTHSFPLLESHSGIIFDQEETHAGTVVWIREEDGRVISANVMSINIDE